MRLWCIHGNLQRATVWAGFEGVFGCVGVGLRLVCEDLWGSPAGSFAEWTEQFTQKVEQASDGQPQWLMGYSQGGRLALHAVIARPELFRGVVVIGGDLGLENVADCPGRVRHDQWWGQRFLTEPWDELLAEWDGQGVFGGRPNAAPRREGDFSREGVARLFDVFSKGRQAWLLPQLVRLHAPPILFVAGAEDGKYGAIGERFAREVPAGQLAIIPNAAHRVPWENPAGFITAVQTFIYRVVEF